MSAMEDVEDLRGKNLLEEDENILANTPVLVLEPDKSMVKHVLRIRYIVDKGQEELHCDVSNLDTNIERERD